MLTDYTVQKCLKLKVKPAIITGLKWAERQYIRYILNQSQHTDKLPADHWLPNSRFDPIGLHK